MPWAQSLHVVFSRFTDEASIIYAGNQFSASSHARSDSSAGSSFPAWISSIWIWISSWQQQTAEAFWRIISREAWPAMIKDPHLDFIWIWKVGTRLLLQHIRFVQLLHLWHTMIETINCIHRHLGIQQLPSTQRTSEGVYVYLHTIAQLRKQKQMHESRPRKMKWC